MALLKLRPFLPVFAVIGATALALSGCSSSNDTSPGGSDAGSDAGGSPGVILDGGGEISPPPNGESLCPQGACNYQTQQGCGATEACRPAVGANNQLSPACQSAGQGKSGDSCQDWTECAHGYLCAGGECHKLCCGGDWTACPSGESCIRRLLVQVGSQNVDSGASLCFPVNNCDVLDATSCQGQQGRSCQIVDPTGNVACAPEGQGSVGDACSETVHCSAGFSCVAHTCRRLCRAVAGGGDPSCPAGEGTCIHYNRDPAGVGECTPG